MPDLTPETVLAALSRGPATPDALAARLGGADRESLIWVVDDLLRAGAIVSTADGDCGPDGLCATSVPTVYSLAGSRAHAADGVSAAAAVAGRSRQSV